MKSRKEEFTVKGTKYPCLKIGVKGTGQKEVVLFTSKKTGTVVQIGNNVYKLGYFCETWQEVECFSTYHGEIILSSED